MSSPSAAPGGTTAVAATGQAGPGLSAPLVKAKRSGRRGEALAGALMVSPAVFLLIMFFVVPAVLAFALAFTNARLVSPRAPVFIGLSNFANLFSDTDFWDALRNTLYFTVIVVPVQSGLALVLALLVNIKLAGTNFFRTLYFIPVVTSMVVVSLLWTFMYQREGLLNKFIEGITFGAVQGPDWLNNPSTSMPAIIFMSVWQAVGFHMVIWLSGLQTIPADLYDAAALDGVTPWQQFKYVTWPCLKATRTFILVTITIAAFSLFTQVSVMTQGGPLNSTTTLVYMGVRAGYQQQQTGYASAIALVFFALVLVVSLIQRFLTRDKD